MDEGARHEQKDGATMRAVVWVPGVFSLTNKMLDNLRAAEKYHGRRPKNWRDLFAEETAAIRLATKVAANRKRLEAPQKGEVCLLAFIVFGHHKHDRDAWYLLGKAALDGLVDAHVIGSDRFEVWNTGGIVLRTDAEERFVAKAFGVVVGEPGLLIDIIYTSTPDFEGGHV